VEDQEPRSAPDRLRLDDHQVVPVEPVSTPEYSPPGTAPTVVAYAALLQRCTLLPSVTTVQRPRAEGRESAEGLRPLCRCIVHDVGVFCLHAVGCAAVQRQDRLPRGRLRTRARGAGRRWAALGPALTARSVVQRRRRGIDRATQVCMDVGGRLCTYNEMSAGITIGTGCMYDI
jgi:hypothetical protein